MIINMKKRYLLFFLFCLLFISVSAQTLTVAKALYGKGQYEKAKPTFKKLVKAQPGNGNYNFWYGVCCLKTQDPKEAVKHLETAVKRRIPSGQLYLAQAYNDLYQFENAIKCYEDYINELSKRKKPTEEAEALLKKAKTNFRMLKGIEKVCIIDSFVVDKQHFLNAYKISSESGKLFMYNTFFQTDKEAKATVYKTELGNKIYYSEIQANGKYNIFGSNKIQDEWSKGEALSGNFDQAGNSNYPYVLTDGITLYYAADGENSMGGYDIFVTRYNTESNSYLTPENIGMPFNSPYNDYMYVIDEFNNLGWFASDRYQPAGKVCIYVFVPNQTKQVYNYESMDPARVIHLAQIHSVKETWYDKNLVADAKVRLQTAFSEKPQIERSYDFEFVIDDQKTYHQLSDFKSAKAKGLFVQYRQSEKDLKQQQHKLRGLRAQYARMNDEKEKAKLAPAILDLEARVLNFTNEVKQMAVTIRNTEKEN
jgi:tetratricopeptide (TPR) repeat protein